MDALKEVNNVVYSYRFSRSRWGNRWSMGADERFTHGPLELGFEVRLNEAEPVPEYFPVRLIFI